MSGWLNWREIEKHNDWGVRDKDDETAAMWSRGAHRWEARAIREEEFNRRQVESLHLNPDDEVLDVCCGPGPLTRWIAPCVKRVTAWDYSEEMLKYVKEKADLYSLTNVEYLQGNFNTMVPGIDAPKFDVAVTRHSPAQGNILLFSQWATKRCVSFNLAYPFRTIKRSGPTGWIKSAAANQGKLNVSDRPDGRLYGFNIHFNLLYDSGANPNLYYVTDETHIEGHDKEEIYMKFNKCENIEAEDFAFWCRRMEPNFRETDYGLVFEEKQILSVLDWDPSEIDWDYVYSTYQI